MKFYTNKISTGKAPNFSDFVQKLASANSVIKTAAEHVKDEEKCLEGAQDKLPAELKEKIIEKKKDEGECKDSVKEAAAEKDEKHEEAHDKKEEEKSDGKKECLEKEECYASAQKMVRIANLDAKTKSEWKAYWKKLYPSEYVEAMFADK